MKKILSISALLFFALLTQAQTRFYEGSWEDAFAEAKKQNKYLFIDCYTDWCSWCKVADKKTFPSKEVAAYLNEQFIAVKVDMERGTGVELGMKYRISGFPSYLIIAPDGSFAHKMSGYFQKTSEFVAELKKGMDNKNHPVYPAKLMDELAFPDFYAQSFTNKDLEIKRAKPDAKVVAEWLGRQKDLFSVPVWSVMYRFGLNEEFETYFLKNQATYAKLYGKDEVTSKVVSIGRDKLRLALESKEKSDLALATGFVRKYFKEDAEKEIAYYQLRFTEVLEDWPEYVEQAEALIKLYGLENHLGPINGYGWNMYLKVDDKALLTTAAGWMKKVCELDPLYMYLDTYAALLYKAGNYNEALAWADKAISTGKADEEDVEETEVLRKKIIVAKEGK